jgi:uncharacterized protein
MTVKSQRLVNNLRDTPPVPAYLPGAGESPLKVNRDLYNQIYTAPRELVEVIDIDVRSAKAWKVPQGYICRLSTPEGPQVGDLNIWNFHNPRERFWASRTRQLHQTHVSTYDRLWSTLPYLRPLCTIVRDTLSDYGVDKWGGRVHDLLGTRCDPYVGALLSGQQMDFHCHSNLTRAVLPFGLTEFDVHDVLNVFQVTGLDDSGRYFMETSPSTKQDYLEIFAEVDLLCALSACPGGDLSSWGWDHNDGDGMVSNCRPLRAEVYKIVNQEEVLKDWVAPEVAPYTGRHGLVDPVSSNSA